MNTLDRLIKTAIEPIESAYSLPFSAYTDKSVFDAERDRIFSKEWLFACMDMQLSDKGSYFSLQVAGEPVVLLRGEDKQLRAFSNICRHRGTPLLDEGFGKVERYVRCPYHAWAYSLSGDLKAIPHNKIIAVDLDEHSLHEFQVATWNGLVFVNLDSEAPPLSKRLGDIDRYLAIFEPETFDHVEQGDTEFWQSNWKLAIENAIESYHLFQVHEQTLEQYTPTKLSYYIAGSSEWALTGGANNRKKGVLETLLGSTHPEAFEHYILVSLPPSFVAIVSYGSIAWLSIYPVSSNESCIRSGSLGWKSAMDTSQAIQQFTRDFFAEDKQICERVQKGMSARCARGGKLVDMERVLVDFHHYLATRLASLPATELYEEEHARLFKQ